MPTSPPFRPGLNHLRPSRVCWPSGRRTPEPGEMLPGRHTMFEVLDVLYIETPAGLRAQKLQLRCGCGAVFWRYARSCAYHFACESCSA